MTSQAGAGAGTGAGRREPSHALRIFLPWLVVSVVADWLIWSVWGPHLPPGDMASAASNQQFDIKVMAVIAAPVTAFVLIYFGYALVVWRQRDGAPGTRRCRSSPPTAPTPMPSPSG